MSDLPIVDGGKRVPRQILGKVPAVGLSHGRATKPGTAHDRFTSCRDAFL